MTDEVGGELVIGRTTIFFLGLLRLAEGAELGLS